MDLAMSSGVVPLATSFLLPSGKVTVMVLMVCAASGMKSCGTQPFVAVKTRYSSLAKQQLAGQTAKTERNCYLLSSFSYHRSRAEGTLALCHFLSTFSYH